MSKSFVIAIAAVFCLFVVVEPAQADSIHVINAGVGGHPMVQNAIANLNALGHTVTTGGTLADYSAFDQVWDLRYDVNLGGGDVAAMGAFLAGGGRMYLTGEHQGFDASRNVSLRAFVAAVGGGNLTMTSDFGSPTERVTAAGQVVNSPNAFATVAYSAARNVQTTTGNGFLVTSNDGLNGALVGWDFGDIVGAAGARMLVGFDIEIFQPNNGQNWTENMATYLGNAPEPASLALLGIGALALVRRRRKNA